jgi:hypothetical protein
MAQGFAASGSLLCLTYGNCRGSILLCAKKPPHEMPSQLAPGSPQSRGHPPAREYVRDRSDAAVRCAPGAPLQEGLRDETPMDDQAAYRACN